MIHITVDIPALNQFLTTFSQQQGQLLAKMAQMETLLSGLVVGQHREGEKIMALLDQVQQLSGLEVQEHQEILAAAARVQTQLGQIANDNPGLATVIAGVQNDIGTLTSIAATAGTGGTVTAPAAVPADQAPVEGANPETTSTG